MCKVARARYVEKNLQKHLRTRVGGASERPIIVEDEGDQEVDDTGRLSDLIAPAEAGLEAEKEEGDTERLSELIGLAEAGWPAEEDGLFSQTADEAEATYYNRKADLANAGQTSHMTEAEEDALFSQAADEAEAAYYSRQAQSASCTICAPEAGTQ